METRAHHILIGLFTVLATAAILAFALWLSGSKDDVQTRHYVVIFNEPITGLSRGSAVQYSGIRVGNVAELNLDRRDPRKVIARIQVDAGVPVKQDTRARLAITGITGNAVIQLTGGTPESPLLQAPEGQDPVIVATPSPLSRLLADGDDVMGNINELLFNAKTLLSPQNTAHISATLANLEAATGALAGQREALDDLVTQLRQASREGTRTLAQATQLLENANAALTGEGGQALASANQAMTSLARTAERIDGLLSANGPALDSGLQGIGQLGPAVNELRSAMAALTAIARRLEDNPANYLLGRERIEEFRP
ncbi:MlaD family protein [Orrella sp. JC864]|uniref:MlaD family protein n=1 Tax=Orrella sp. JC864 TaxID=3120298 RepID=UPI0012BCDD91